MSIQRIPGVGPTNDDVAAAVVTAGTSAGFAATGPTTTQIAAVLPSNSSIQNLIQTYAASAGVTNTSIQNIVQTYAGGKTFTVQEFNNTGNWTAPSGVNAVQIFLVGGGGGGGGSTNNNANGAPSAGGGGGQVFIGTKPVTPGTNYTVTIGGGGAGGNTLDTNTGNNGSIGGTSSFGNLASAIGGGGGRGVRQSTDPTVGWSGGGGGIDGGGTMGAAGAGGGAGGDAQGITYAATVNRVQIFANNFSQNWVNPQPPSGGGGSGAAGFNEYNNNDPVLVANAGPGLFGYAGGGAGGIKYNGSTTPRYVPGRGKDGGGNGAFPTSQNTFTVGNAGAANKGGGGGGVGGTGSIVNNPQVGYAGGSGYCRIEYFA